jgi:hypothetical protein
MVQLTESTACTHFDVLRCRWTRLLSSAGMPNPSDKTENTLRDDANRIAGELEDEKAAIVFGALLIADAISRGTGRITEATALRR